MPKTLRLFSIRKSRKIDLEGFPTHAVGLISSSTLDVSQASSNGRTEDASETYSLVRTVTNDTIDDNPGPGRLIDKYIYQRYGRKIERLLGRMSLPFIPTGVLAQRILDMQSSKFLCGVEISVDHAFGVIAVASEGTAIIQGLKCIAKHVQSGSFQRRAVALAALIQLSSTCTLYMILFKDLIRKGILTQYHELLDSARISEEEKLQFNTLSDLAQSTISARQYHPPSFELAHWLRKRLVPAVFAYRQKAFDPLLLIGHAHGIFCEGIASILYSRMHMQGSTTELEDVLNVTFHCSAFLVRALGDLSVENNNNRESDPFRGLLVSLYIHLMNEDIHGVSKAFTCFEEGASPMLLHTLFSLNSLLRVLAPGNEEYRDFSSDTELDDSFFQLYLLSMPYRVRMHALCQYHAHPGTSVYLSMLSVGAMERRNASLLLPTIDRIIVASHIQVRMYDEARDALGMLMRMRCREESDEDLLRTRARAREVEVRDPRAPFVWEFLECRSPQDGEPEDDDGFQLTKWRQYRMRLAARKAWGEHLRSRYEWEWDVAKCLNRLFRRNGERRKRVRVCEGANGQLDVSVSTTQAHLPKTIRVAVVSDTGEVTYRTYEECGGSASVCAEPLTREDVVGQGGSGVLEEGQGPGQGQARRFRATCEEVDEEE